MELTRDHKRFLDCKSEVINWLHHCWSVKQQGFDLMVNPFYKRTALLTPDIVSAVIQEIEDLWVDEIRRYPEYHNTHQGIKPGEVLVPSRFDRWSPACQLAIVQGLDEIYQRYAASTDPLETASPQPPAPELPPEYYC